MPSSSPCRLLALGDSYTIGESIGATERWPSVLVERLRRGGPAVVPPTLIARTGWTAAELEAAVQEAALDPPYDLVALLIGVNDQYRGLETGSYRATLRRLLGRSIRLAGGASRRVIALSIPDWGVTPYADGHPRARIAGEIGRFNAVVRAEARRLNVGYVDVTALSRAAAYDPGLIAPDGLHPSGAMYQRWVDRMWPTVRAALNDSVAAVH